MRRNAYRYDPPAAPSLHIANRVQAVRYRFLTKQA